MKIYLASYQSIMLNKGGPTYKLLQMQATLNKLGYDVSLYDMWDQNITASQDTLFHIFNASLETYSLAVNLIKAGYKYVVNPIFFSNHRYDVLKLYRFLEKILTYPLPRTYSDYELTARICQMASMVLPNTNAEAQLLIKGLNIDSARVRVIPNGVEARFASADADIFFRKFGLQDFILYVGHLGPPRKNGRNIIRALQRLNHPAVIIADVINNEEGRWCLKAMEESSNIHFLNWMDHDDPLLASAYAACRIFILPTRYETPGRAALEAALAGAGIVITPRGGTREYFLDMAEYINPDSVTSIVGGMENALLKPRSDALKKHIMANYTWERIAEQTIQLYQEILKA
ncbi:MAG: glycosyltransferase [Candidatus Cloacimonetes bacterium]|nr:glycosyltransferase [Candidatus Cloacimonadota bacterium]